MIGDFWFTSLEAYVQDNWRVNRRLTVDVGVRFYHLPPQANENNTSAAFVGSAYDPKMAARLYYPGYDAAGKQVAVDRMTGQMTYPSLVTPRIDRSLPVCSCVPTGAFAVARPGSGPASGHAGGPASLVSASVPALQPSGWKCPNRR